jgi:hypothetical protein
VRDHNKTSRGVKPKKAKAKPWVSLWKLTRIDLVGQESLTFVKKRRKWRKF